MTASNSRQIVESVSVASEPHIFGRGRMMEIYHEGLGYADVGVFHSMDEALKWLERR